MDPNADTQEGKDHGDKRRALIKQKLNAKTNMGQKAK